MLITTADADSKFHPRYLEALEWRYLTVKNSENCIYQAPLLYNWELDAASFVTRVTGILRAFLMMGALIPLNINTMSIFSFSSSLCIAGDFVHPAYQMDDIIMLIRWMGVCKKRLRIIMVPVPVLSGNFDPKLPPKMSCLNKGRQFRSDFWTCDRGGSS